MKMKNCETGSSGGPKAADPRIDLAWKRTGTAGFRTQLALDRTTLAWIRTTLTMASFGFGMVGFFRSVRQQSPTPESIQLHAAALQFGYTLLILGILATVLAGASHWLTLRRLRRGEMPVLTQWPASITVAMLLAIAGLAALWSLLIR
jgi:uncharacterized membrane protein YidH (DUF202 family)